MSGEFEDAGVMSERSEAEACLLFSPLPAGVRLGDAGAVAVFAVLDELVEGTCESVRCYEQQKKQWIIDCLDMLKGSDSLLSQVASRHRRRNSAFFFPGALFPEVS